MAHKKEQKRTLGPGDRGDDVRTLQKEANKILESRKFRWRKVGVDGILGPRTFSAAHMAGWLQGLSDTQLTKIGNGVLTPYAQRILTRKERRSDAMKDRDEQRRSQAAELREAHRRGGLETVAVHSTGAGHPHWGGAKDIFDQFVIPFLHGKWGLPIGSQKRTPAENDAVGGSKSSDHLTTQTTTFATDFPTLNGEEATRALAGAMGNSSWQPNSYASFDVKVDGHACEVQLLWGGDIGHGDHIHAGIQLGG